MSRNERMKIVWVKSENIEMAHTKKPSPHTGKVSALADGRGKYEQKRKNGYMSKNENMIKSLFLA